MWFRPARQRKDRFYWLLFSLSVATFGRLMMMEKNRVGRPRFWQLSSFQKGKKKRAKKMTKVEKTGITTRRMLSPLANQRKYHSSLVE